ncbi:MAG: alpha/beta hydrolase [Desulfitobacterium sp.]|nr:alpha/beta hydrolase [Desulfitobacterium sp.]
MKKSRIPLVLLVIISALIITGCSTDTKGDANNPDSTFPQLTEVTQNLKSYNLESSQENKFEVDFFEFDLGSKEYLSQAGRIMPYNIKGVIGVPKGEGPFPLILITHGSHSNDDESKRFDTGFDYLVKSLAANGFITVSMDMSKPYIWKYGDNDDNEKLLPVADDHITSLKSAHAGNNPGYPLNLQGKINLDQVALIGHSRGGETIIDIANDQVSKGIKIKSLLAIAPTFYFEREWPDAEIAILVPEYDGDLVGLDGFNLYRALNGAGQNFHSITLLMKGNHNYFNRNIERNDAIMAVGKDGIKDQLSRGEQEEFLTNFAVDFFNSSLLGKKESFLNPQTPQPNKMYGFDVKTMYKANSSVSLMDANSLASLQGEGVQMERKIDSWFFKFDEVLIDTITTGGGPDEPDHPFLTKPLINIKWEEKGSKVSISPLVTNFKDYNSLTLNLVIDSAADLNPQDKAQQFTIAVQDQAGNSAKIILPENLNALKPTPGELDSTPLLDTEIIFWSRPSPLASINIPLGELSNLNLQEIATIDLLFDQIDTGSIYLESIYLQ